MLGGLGWQELLIVLLIAVLLFGGNKLGGLGRASGKAIREFKEETAGMSKKKTEQDTAVAPSSQPAPEPTVTQNEQTASGDTVNPSTNN